MPEQPTQPAAYVVKRTKSGRETKRPYDANNIEHVWAKYIGVDGVNHTERGTTYQYIPAPGVSVFTAVEPAKDGDQ